MHDDHFCIIFLVLCTAFASAVGPNGQKTILCHFEAAHFDEELQEDIPDTWSVITINDRALPAHMGEGDDGHVDTVIENDDDKVTVLGINLDVFR